MLPFLLVSTRPEEEALASEYNAYLRSTHLGPDQLELAEFDLVGLPEIDPANYAGVFVAGSPYGGGANGYVSQTQKWVQQELAALFTQLLEAETPLLATGNATPILAKVLGWSVSSEFAEFGELTEIELTREAKQDPVFDSLPEAFPAYVNHGEAVETLPASAVRLARSLNTPVQVFRTGERVYGVQFSPELDAELIGSRITAFHDAGDSGIGDTESLVTTGRYGAGNHVAGRVLANFVEVFGDV